MEDTGYFAEGIHDDLLTLLANIGSLRVISRTSVLKYRDTDPWPDVPDGSGFTLAKRNPATGTALPENWTVSGQPNGTPGGPNTFPSTPSVAFNERTSGVTNRPTAS